MSKYRLDGTQLALLSNLNTVTRVYYDKTYQIKVNNLNITAEFRVENRADSEIEELCKKVNRVNKLGFFRNRGTVVEYSDTIFYSNFLGFRLATFIMNAIQKFEANLKNYISVFYNMEKTESINFSKVMGPVSQKVEYDNYESFKKDCEFILAILNSNNISFDFLFPGSIKIKALKCIKYYRLPYLMGKSVSLKNQISNSKEVIDIYMNFKEKLSKADIKIFDESKFDLFVDYTTKQVHLFPRRPLSEIFYSKQKIPPYVNMNLTNKYPIKKKSSCFANVELLINCPAYRLVEIESDIEKNIKMYEDTKELKNENIILNFGVISRTDNTHTHHSEASSLEKFYFVFENYEVGSLKNYFIGDLSSTHFMDLNKIIQILIKFSLDKSFEEKKYYYTISIQKLSFIEKNLRIYQSISPQKNYSDVSPEELFVMVAYHNKSYFIVLKMLFHFNIFSNFMGKALKYVFKRPENVSKSKNSREILKSLCVKYEKNIEFAEYASKFDTFFYSIAENIVKELSPGFKPANYMKSESLNPEECQKVKNIIILSIIFRQKKLILEELFNHLIKPFPKLISKQPNIRLESEIRQKLIITDFQSIDIEKFIEQNEIKIKVEQILKAQCESKMWDFPENFTLNYEKFEKLGEIVKKRYWHEFEEAQGFGENLLSSRIKKLCENEEISETRSNIYLIGRVVYDSLFAERNKNFNKNLEKASKNFSEYVKLVLRKRVSYMFSKSDEIDLSKYVTLCRTMMSCSISQRPSEESIFKQLNLN